MRRQHSLNALRPLDQAEAVKRVFKSKLPYVFGLFEAVEIEMENRKRLRLIGLDQRESRARRLGRAGEGGDDRARQRRFAGAERPRQRDDIAGAKPRRQPRAWMDAFERLLPEENTKK